MRLTIENDPERIKRFSHIKPAPMLGSVLCDAKCPGTVRACTLQRGHSGPHVAHGTFRRVVAVWDAGIKERTVQKKARRPAKIPASVGMPGGSPLPELVSYLGRIMKRTSVEEVVFLILAISMVAFAVDWALRILGVR